MTLSKPIALTLIYAGFLLNACAPKTETKHSDKIEQIENNIEYLLEQYNAPGLSVAIIENGKITYSKGFGFRDLERQYPVNEHTKFGIGSITKSFTSGLIGTYVDEGLLSLDDTAVSRVDGLKFHSAEMDENITIHRLLSQTSAMAHSEGSWSVFPEQNQADLAKRQKYFPATGRVGDYFSYNNMNFVTLDMIAEAVGGGSKAGLLQDRILGPLGMDDTLTTTASMEASPDAAIGYGLRGETMKPVPYEYLFGEQVYTTASDMAKWLRLWLGNGSIDGKQILSADYVKSALSAQIIKQGAPPSREEPGVHMFGYGYGWEVFSRNGHYTVRHGGNESGFSSSVVFFPTDGLGVVALTNQNLSILPMIVTDMMSNYMLDIPQKTLITEYPISVQQANKVYAPDYIPPLNKAMPPAFAFSGAVGRFTAKGYGEITVELQGERLWLITPYARFLLAHDEANKFKLTTVESIPEGMNLGFFEARFITSNDNKVSHVEINLAREPVRFGRTE